MSKLEDGYGVLENQFFTLEATTTKNQFDRLKNQYARDPSVLNNNGLASYYPFGENYDNDRNLTAGDRMYVDILGPLNGYVMFTNVALEENSFWIEGRTLQGELSNYDAHPDNGIIRFTGTFDTENNIARIQIWNSTKAGTAPAYFGGFSSLNLNAGRGAQKSQWRTVIKTIQEFMGVDDQDATKSQVIIKDDTSSAEESEF